MFETASTILAQAESSTAPPPSGSGQSAPPPSAPGGAQSMGGGSQAAPSGTGQGQAIEGQDGSPRTGNQPASSKQNQTGGGLLGGIGGLLIPLLLIGVLLLIMIGPQRKEKKRRQQMMDSLSKGDRIQTAGGILGTVTEIRDHELVVKVDENANTRLRFAKSAVQSVQEKETAREGKS